MISQRDYRDTDTTGKSLINLALIHIPICTVMTKSLFSSFSFGMAYEFIDCVGDDVDVVSDSEVSGAFAKLTFLSLWLKHCTYS